MQVIVPILAIPYYLPLWLVTGSYASDGNSFDTNIYGASLVPGAIASGTGYYTGVIWVWSGWDFVSYTSDPFLGTIEYLIK